jgi:hypothetical protein
MKTNKYLFSFLIFIFLALVYTISIYCTTKNSFIPKKIYQTYKSKSSVPQKVFDNINKYAPEYEYEFFSDEDCVAFIKKHFEPIVLTSYNSLQNTAHKADLFRYCLLYIHGGIYLDIKTVLLKPLKDIFKDTHVYSAISFHRDKIYQGIIASRPKNNFFLGLIEYIVNANEITDYQMFTINFYTQILNNINSDIKPGLNSGKQNFYLFQEECSCKSSDCPDGLDRYGYCCFIYDNGEKIFQVRYADFPWN